MNYQLPSPDLPIPFSVSWALHLKGLELRFVYLLWLPIKPDRFFFSIEGVHHWSLFSTVSSSAEMQLLIQVFVKAAQPG